MWVRIEGARALAGLMLAWSLGAALAPTPAIAAAPPRYHVIDTGLAGAGYGLNDSGVMVGQAAIGAQPNAAFAWARGHTLVPGHQDNGARAMSINTAGAVCGYILRSDGMASAVRWRTNGSVLSLGTLGGSGSVANAINDSGVIVGSSTLSGDLVSVGFVYRNGRMRALPSLGGDYAFASDINAQGDIVGSSNLYFEGIELHAFAFSQGRMHDLGTLGGGTSYGRAINALGHVVGSANYSPFDDATHAFFHDGRVMHDLGSLAGDSAAIDINDHDVIVGVSNVQFPLWRAWIYVDGRMHDLTKLLDAQSQGWTFPQVWAINNAGQIAAVGTFGGVDHAVLLTPVAP